MIRYIKEPPSVGDTKEIKKFVLVPYTILIKGKKADVVFQKVVVRYEYIKEKNYDDWSNPYYSFRWKATHLSFWGCPSDLYPILRD